ncbi:MAG: hypothetical protein IJC25_02510, partial [Clostridia bacterium]|nr:hypothetical protein [Clostridia bacterium]
MDVLYLSHLCSQKEYERMFAKQNTAVSHAAQKFHRLMLNGLMQNGCRVDALTQRILYTDEKTERRRPDETENGVHYTYLPCCKNRAANRLMTMLAAYRVVRKWNREHPQGVVVCDIILGELSLAVWLAHKVCGLRAVAVVTDVPAIRAGDDR